jgi:hypothetical protein
MEGRVITQQRLHELLKYDPKTGDLVWQQRSRPGSHVIIGAVAGTPMKKGHLRVWVDGVPYLAHRLAWLHIHGEWPKHEIDHINGIPHDNRIENLRDVMRSENAQNRYKAHRQSKTKVLGVIRRYRRYVATIRVDGKTRHIGQFATADEAHAAYLAAKHIYHPTAPIGAK